MRDYLSPAKKMLERVMPHPAAIHAFFIKRRALSFIIVASSIAVLTLSVVTVRAMTSQKTAVENTVKAEGKTSTLSVSQSSANENPKAKEQPMTSQQTVPPEPESSNDSKTTVTINNEQIPLSADGSVERTITNDNGTTQISVSTNSDSNGNSYTSSFMTTNSSSTSMNNSTVTSNSQNVSITTQ